MKRYLAFIGEVYYPSGGMGDFIGDFDTLEEAIIFIKKSVDESKYSETFEQQWGYTWAHVWDTETRTEAWSK